MPPSATSGSTASTRRSTSRGSRRSCRVSTPPKPRSPGCGSTAASRHRAAARLRTMDRNPQGREMADESMVRNLAAQALAIWPQEQPLFQRYAPRAILDIGCGTGEITSRLATMFPDATAIGIDIIEAHLALARDRYASFGDRLQFTTGDA